MKRFTIVEIIILILIIPLILGIGCSTAKSILELSSETAKDVSDRIIPDKKPVLKKRVMISQILNQSALKEDRVEKMTANLREMLENDMILVTLTEIKTPSRDELRSPEFGVIINPEIVEKAEKTGMNIAVTCILNPFDLSSITTGIWPLRKVKKEIEISVSLNAIDITYGTLFLSALETRNIKVGNDFSEEKDISDYDKEIDKELSSILKTLANDLLDEIENFSWSGTINMNNDGKMVINGGKDIGVTEGSLFEVFEKKESIRSMSGKTYYFLGPKEGEIRIDSVREDYSVATPLDNLQFSVGQIVRLKR